MMAADRLSRIVADVRRRLEARRRQVAERELERRAAEAVARWPRRSLARAIAGGRRRPRPHVIAEVKRRSPAAGDLGAGTDAAAQAARYAAGGASAISVVTEPDHFGGDPHDLARVRPLGLPVLQKDFILDRYQILESAVLGADCILLIARILPADELARLLAEAAAVGLEALVEVNDPEDVSRALAAGASLIGINNRDLATFQVDPERTARLLPLLPPDAIVVSASGMATPGDVRRAHALGVDACLVGEALMRSPSPEAWLAEATGWTAPRVGGGMVP